MRKLFKRFSSVVLVSLFMFAMTSCEKEKEENVFNPSLDTNITATLNIKGFFENFEALDKVKADFKYYYPNVSLDYSVISSNKLSEFLGSNENNDIFMTTSDVLRYNSVFNKCLDLSTADINFDDIDDKFLVSNYKNGVLHSIPIGQNVYGIVVNKTLLEKNGLLVPTNYSEFMNCLKKLKDSGYVPLQSENSKLYAELTYNMMANFFSNDNITIDSVSSIYEIIDNVLPYTDIELNKTYPYDNYDGAIKKFFHGDVPFWVCNCEKVSGMKKREKKWEDFTVNPFEYTYINAPISKDGCYVFSEAWFGFSVNKDSKNLELAKEFMRLMTTSIELNNMANVKRIPSVAKKKKSLDVYYDIDNPTKVVSSFINDGSLTAEISLEWYRNVNNYISNTKSKEEAIRDFVSIANK